MTKGVFCILAGVYLAVMAAIFTAPGRTLVVTYAALEAPQPLPADDVGQLLTERVWCFRPDGMGRCLWAMTAEPDGEGRWWASVRCAAR